MITTTLQRSSIMPTEYRISTVPDRVHFYNHDNYSIDEFCLFWNLPVADGTNTDKNVLPLFALRMLIGQQINHLFFLKIFR